MTTKSPSEKRRVDTTILLIDQNWKVGDVSTVKECDEALIVLKMGMDSIKDQLDEHRDSADTGWLKRAKSALTLKQAAYMAVMGKRAALSAEQKKEQNKNPDLISILKEFILTNHGKDQWDELVRDAKEGSG